MYSLSFVSSFGTVMVIAFAILLRDYTEYTPDIINNNIIAVASVSVVLFVIAYMSHEWSRDIDVMCNNRKMIVVKDKSS